MKIGAISHPKMHHLASLLGECRRSAIGLLTLLWYWAAEHAVQGDVGKWPDSAIARGCDWDSDPAELINALVAARWLDRDPVHRLLIHDWAEHCERWIALRAQKLKLEFAKPTPVASTKPSIEATVENSAEATEVASTKPSTRPVPSRPDPARLFPSTNGNGKHDDDSPTVMEFSCVGKGHPTWKLTEAKVAEYQLSFPGVDVLAECRAARQWATDNPTKRKTAKGMPAFLNRWLTSAQNKGSTNRTHRGNLVGAQNVTRIQSSDYDHIH
jgi:hypothetical protein